MFSGSVWVALGLDGHRLRRRVIRAARAEAEELERRYLLSLSAALAGPPGAVTAGNTANLVLTMTGSSTPASATIHPGDSGSPQTFTSFSSPPSRSVDNSLYNTAGTYSPSATTTSPSLGTIPLTLDDLFNATGSTVGSFATQPPGSVSSDNNSGAAIAVNGADGSVFVLSAFNETSTTSEFCVTKYDSTGAVVTGWGNQSPTQNGTCVINFDSAKDVPSAISLGENGTCLMVAGNSSTDGWCVAVIDAQSGGLKTSFASNGLDTNFHLAGTCTSVLMENDSSSNNEKILLGGWETKNGAPQMLIIRLTNPGGAVDSATFNHNSTTAGELYVNAFPSTTGSKAFTMEQDAYPNSADYSDDIFLGGYSSHTVGSCAACDLAIAAVTPDGVLDSSWGNNSNGTTTTSFHCVASIYGIGCCSGCGNVSNDADYSLLSWQDTGATGQPWYLYAIGVTNFSGIGNQFAMERLKTGGLPDATWQSHGLTAVSSGAASAATAQAATLEGGSSSLTADQDPNAMIVAAGTGTATNVDFVVARFSMSGNLDSANFGSGGSTHTDLANSTFNSGYDNALGVGWDYTDGVIFVGGSTGSTSSGGYIGVAAYISNFVQVNSRTRPRPGGKSAAAAAAQPLTTGVLDPADAATWKHRRRAADLFAPGTSD